MNRHQRRATHKQNRAIGGSEGASQAMELLQSFNSLKEFSQLAERLKPHLEKLEKLSEELEGVNEVVNLLKKENEALKGELELQREVMIRMFSYIQFNSSPVQSPETVRGVETTILDELQIEEEKFKEELNSLLPQEGASDADTNTQEV